MVRGINRKVIEIADSDSAYFERVLFFLKDSDEIRRENVDTIKAQGEEYLLTPVRAGIPEKSGSDSAVRGAALLSAAFAGGVAAFLFF